MLLTLFGAFLYKNTPERQSLMNSHQQSWWLNTELVGTLPTVELQNIHGGEIYYNLLITPSTRLTFDMQVINNSNVSDDVAIVLGARLHIKL